LAVIGIHSLFATAAIRPVAHEHDVPPPLTTHRLLTDWQFAPVVTAGLAAAAAAYLLGIVLVRRRHPSRPWPIARTGAFFAGLAVIAVATESGLAAYDDVLFWVHMWQHLLLLMVAPPLLILGEPLTLLLHASRNPVHRWAVRLLRSRPIQWVTHPLVGVSAYTVTVVVTHLTSFMNLVLTNSTVHDVEHVWYLAAGYLYFLPLLGREPIRWRLTFPLRLFLLFLAMPVDTFTGVVLLQTSYEPFPAYLGRRDWGPSLLDDLHAGGAVMWIGGDGIMLVIMLAAFVAVLAGRGRMDMGRWLESLRAARFAALGAASGVGVQPPAENTRDGAGTDTDVDQQLAAYNAYLARLHAMEEHDSRGEQHSTTTGGSS
jgi:cytochrome c oxidase assembly factor CtaG